MFTDEYVEVAPPPDWDPRWWKPRPVAIRLAQREWQAYDEDEWKVFAVSEGRHVMLMRSFPFWMADHDRIRGLGLVQRKEGSTVCKVIRFFRRLEGSIENASELDAARG